MIEAGVLAKVIMVGDFLRLGRALKPKTLFLRALYQTLIFTVWVALFSLLEKTARGLFHGKGLTEGFEEMVSKGPYEVLAWCIVAFVAFIPFFGFRELEQELGKEKLRALFWGHK